MIKRTLEHIAKMINGSELNGESTIVINGVSINSRDDLAGKLFIPIKGERFNGHEFVEDAFKKGAVAALWQKGETDYPKDRPLIFVDDTITALQQLAKSYRNELPVKVVGVTGSNGKTSTKDMVYSVLSTTYNVLKTEGNLNNHLGLPLSILKASDETEVLVLEMGMSARGEIELLSKLAEPDVAIITNIGESHLQDLGSREEISEAKLEITAGLKSNGAFIYFGDEPLLQQRIHRYKDIRFISFGESDTNEYYPVFIKQESRGTSFTTNKVSRTMFIPVLGKHNVYNALAATAAGQVLDVEWEDIVKGLSQLQITQMRTEMVELPNGATVINDAYNASPTSMKAAIGLVQDLEGYKRKILVLGDMLELGEKEEDFHIDTGEAINPSRIDYVFTYGERGHWIGTGAKRNFSDEHVQSFLNKEMLVKALKEFTKAGDIILVKASRGMKLEELIDTLKG